MNGAFGHSRKNGVGHRLMVSATKLMVVGAAADLIFRESSEDEQCECTTVFIIHTLVIQTLWQN
jgi:hypothetical protein